MANYKNGKSINECRQVTLVNNGIAGDLTNVVISIRGVFQDFNSQVDNYKITITK
ncbi:MAG: hypothetical protein IPO27_18200 [Bacteroidetes bacterium]|nr:hypothetical protein [Bacteroidota bacterium]